MEKRSIFLIAFSIIGVITLSVMESIKTNELVQWIVLIIYLTVVFITMYIPSKKEIKQKNHKKPNKKTKGDK